LARVKCGGWIENWRKTKKIYEPTTVSETCQTWLIIKLLYNVIHSRHILKFGNYVKYNMKTLRPKLTSNVYFC